MSDNRWASTVVGDLSPDRTATASGPFGSNLISADYRGEGVPVIRGENLGRGRWIDGPYAYVDEAKAASLRGNQAIPGDVIFTQRGTLGQVALIPRGPFSTYVLSQSQMRLRPDPRRADPTFLYYLFSSPDQQAYVRSRAIQTGVPHTNLTILRETPVNLPPIEEQRAIASVLGAFDDKIELNRGMSETLEALARAIFTSWFVDFDPVRAKADGRQPVGMDADTAALFADSFDDSPLGPIPSGWPAVRLGSQVDIVRGLSYSGAGLTDANGGGIPLHNLNSIFEGGGYKHDGLKWYTGEFQDRHLVRPGDVIVANTEQGFYELLIGCPAIIPLRFGDIGLFSADLFRIDPKEEAHLTRRYLYCLLTMPRWHDEVAGHANGTTINHLPTDGLTRPWIALPPRPIVERFDTLVAPMLDRQEQLHAENEALRRIRDTLLPSLISGEVRVGLDQVKN